MESLIEGLNIIGEGVLGVLAFIVSFIVELSDRAKRMGEGVVSLGLDLEEECEVSSVYGEFEGRWCPRVVGLAEVSALRFALALVVIAFDIVVVVVFEVGVVEVVALGIVGEVGLVVVVAIVIVGIAIVFVVVAREVFALVVVVAGEVVVVCVVPVALVFGGLVVVVVDFLIDFGDTVCFIILRMSWCCGIKSAFVVSPQELSVIV